MLEDDAAVLDIEIMLVRGWVKNAGGMMFGMCGKSCSIIACTIQKSGRRKVAGKNGGFGKEVVVRVWRDGDSGSRGCGKLSRMLGWMKKQGKLRESRERSWSSINVFGTTLTFENSSG